MQDTFSRRSDKGHQLGLQRMDVDLPDASGVEICRQLRENPSFQTPVVFISGRLLEQDIRRGDELGAVDYIVKPFGVEFASRLLAHIKAKTDSIATLKNTT